MSHLFLFADEAGDFAFKRGPNISNFYIVCTVTMTNCDIGMKLLDLRRRLAWRDAPIKDCFHASHDRQVIRDAVFEVLAAETFDIHATVMEKAKAQPQVRTSDLRFYKYGWHYHFQHSSNLYLPSTKTMMITVASLGTKRIRTEFEDAVRDVVQQKMPRRNWRAAFWPCQTDPCLQAVDYCTWAIQRKWESGGNDIRSYDLIKSKIKYEYELFQSGRTLYY